VILSALLYLLTLPLVIPIWFSFASANAYMRSRV
jgi:hypothetical protein